MTLLNFPANPASVNNIYVAPNGVRYIFDGVKWVGQSAGGGGISTELVSGSHRLTMNPNGSMQFPYFTIPAGDGANGQVLKTNGSGVLSWTSDSTTTYRLYNTNLTQPTQHYTLEVDTNGVVILPDRSIINGSYMRAIHGSYAGLAAGPDLAHNEDSWIWVDEDGAWIATKYSTDAFTWKFDNDGDFVIPNGGHIKHQDGSPYATSATNTGNFIFVGDSIELPLRTRLNSGGIGVTNSAEFGTDVQTDSSMIQTSEIYMGAGTAESRAIVDDMGRSLMYLGVENVGEGKFAGIVAQDPNLDPSQYTVALNGDGLPILGDSTITYATTVGVMNSDFTINGLYVDEIQTVVATGAHTWRFDRNGDVTVPGQIKDAQGNRAVWSNEVPRDISDLTDNGMLLGMSSSTIDINIDGGGAYANYEGTLVRADGGFSSTRWGVNSVIYDGGVGAGGGTYSETLNGGGA